jgi:ABC-type nickel/cobalt efflux system permease component RcnA
MLLELIVAATIGISIGNVWTCIFMGFGTSSKNRSVGKWFIAGRFLGLIILGSVISLLRFAAQDAIPIILLVFGISTITFGLFMLFGHLFRTYFSKEDSHPSPNRSISDNFISSLLSYFMVVPGNRKCKGKNQEIHRHDIQRHHPNGRRKKECKKHGDFDKRYGFTLGVLRGATPCLKVVVLTPLLVAFGFPQSLLLILVYASASTVYPIIGYLSADILSKFEKYQWAFKVLGALILITIGIYTIIKVLMWNTTHIGM